MKFWCTVGPGPFLLVANDVPEKICSLAILFKETSPDVADHLTTITKAVLDGMFYRRLHIFNRLDDVVVVVVLVLVVVVVTFEVVVWLEVCEGFVRREKTTVVIVVIAFKGPLGQEGVGLGLVMRPAFMQGRVVMSSSTTMVFVGVDHVVLGSALIETFHLEAAHVEAHAHMIVALEDVALLPADVDLPSGLHCRRRG